jgi:hypothetical protein
VPRRPERIAEAYRVVLEEAAEGWSRPRGTSSRVAEALARLGVGRRGLHGATSCMPDATLLAEIASRAAAILPRVPEKEREFSWKE